MSSEDPARKGRPTDVAKYDAIVAAAGQQFFDRGFAAASIEQIAADAGVSKVTVYSHFGDKRALFVAAVESECERLRGHFDIGDLPRGSLRTRLHAIGEAMVAFLSRPEMVQFDRRIAAETEHEPEVGAAFLAAGPHRMRQAFAGLLKAMADAASHSPCHPAEHFDLPMSRSDMAGMLGLTIETVSRQFTRLKADGIIDLPSRREVVILDRESLAAEAG